MGKEEFQLLRVEDIKGTEKEPGILVKLLATGEKVSLSLLYAEPGKSFEVHEHEEEELAYIFQGEGIMTVENKSYPVEAPCVLKIPPHLKHGLEVTGNETLLKLNAHSPPRNKALKQSFLGST
jgi:mannose-6-phosphate isomerase-like protein (cupin superfamily)